MSENVTPSEGTLETCLFDYIINDFALLKVIFLGRRGAGDLLRLSTVTNLTVVGLGPPNSATTFKVNVNKSRKMGNRLLTLTQNSNF